MIRADQLSDSPGTTGTTAAADTTAGETAATDSSTSITSPPSSSSHHPVLRSISSPFSAAGASASVSGGSAVVNSAAARGDRRSKLVRERSRSISSAAFAAAAASLSSSSTTFGIKSNALDATTNNTTTAATTPSGNGQNNNSTTSASTTSSGDEKSDAKLVLDNKSANNTKEEEPALLPILFTSFCYKGFEVLFTAINYYHSHEDDNDDDEDDDIETCHLLGIHARTRVRFQKCYLVDPPHNDNKKSDNTNNDSTNLRSTHPIQQATTTNNNNNNKMKKKKKSFATEIVQLTSHPTSGYVFAADNFGNIHSFYPTLSDPMVEAYGKYRWKKGCVAYCREIFGYHSDCFSSSSSGLSLGGYASEKCRKGGHEVAVGGAAASVGHEENEEVPIFFRRNNTTRSNSNRMVGASPSPGRNNANILDNEVQYRLINGQPPVPTYNLVNDGSKIGGEPGNSGKDGVIICASMTEKRVLIVHRDQLAIFDFSLPTTVMPPSTSSSLLPNEALLLWTHKFQGCMIENASLSGDGCAIALVLHGEGVGVPYPCGVRTFVRDREDGSGVGDETSMSASASTAVGLDKVAETSTDRSDTSSTPKSGRGGKPKFGRANKITKPGGILYKPAQFLVHSAPVTRLAFRGYGTRTSSAKHNSMSWCEDMEGNDLLLTTCSSDCSVRIFSQNSWRQLMHWNSPPKSRADWVRGISAANLGDLDSSPTNGGASGDGSGITFKKQREEVVSTPPKPKGMDNASHHSQSSQNSHNAQNKHASSDNASFTSDASAGINRALLSTTHVQPNTALLSPGLTIPSHSIPGTHAGAWIAELTFRNTFPALRLSRLSYLKTGGDDALPAHFESVAAILPPGSITEDVVSEEGGGLGGCRLEVEGIWTVWDAWEPDVRGGRRGVGVAQDVKRDNSSTLSGSGGEFGMVSNPIGEGANPAVATSMANGSDQGGSHMPPSELRLTSCDLLSNGLTQIEMPLWGDKDFGAMEFGSPLRYAMMMPDQSTASRWRTDLPEANLEYESRSRLCARSSMDRRSIHLCWRKHGTVNFEEIKDFNTDDSRIRTFQDLSMCTLPLKLPSLTLPGQTKSSSVNDKNLVLSLHWWPDENYGGPPRLLAATTGGAIIVYEMPPPWSALEPPMPAYDPFNDDDDYLSQGSSVDSNNLSEDDGEIPTDEGIVTETYSESLSRSSGRTEYTVSILPHPDFGLGLRLESSTIEGMPPIAGSFKKHPLSGGRLPAERSGLIALGDEFLAVNGISVEGLTFEDAIGTVRQVGYDSYGSPLLLRFRRCQGRRRSPTTSSPGSASGRKSQGASYDVKVSKPCSGGSLATIEVGADSEIQQGFGRIIAIVRNVLDSPHCHSSDHVRNFSPPAMMLLPWNLGKGATVSAKMYGGALFLWATPGERTIKAARLEAVLDIDPENARFTELGSVSLDNSEGANVTYPEIKSISYVSSTEKGWLVSVQDFAGNVSLLFIEINRITELNDTSAGNNALRASFRHYPNIFNGYGKSIDGNKHDPRDSFILKSFSLELFGTMTSSADRGYKDLTIWSALPQAIYQESENSRQDLVDYNSVAISIQSISNFPSTEVMLDFEWVANEYVESFPWLVVLTQSAAIVFRRSSTRVDWRPSVVFYYKDTIRHSNPLDEFPHLTTALRCNIMPSEEHDFMMKCNWHPESILASICTEKEGVLSALQTTVQGLYSWLSQWMDPDESKRPLWTEGYDRLSNAPLCITADKLELFDAFMPELQIALSPSQNTQDRDHPRQTHRSREFMMAMFYGNTTREDSIRATTKTKSLPVPLKKLNENELHCLWAIGEIMIDSSSFNRLDNCSQLCLFCVLMMRHFSMKRLDHATTSTEPMAAMLSYEGGRPMMLTAQSNSDAFGKERVRFDCIASAAILSALMSDSQAKLLDSCRTSKVDKFNWESARAVGAPFWVRSDKKLTSLAEEIAQTIYRSSKNVMDCAIYYIAMRNMKKLVAIAATDRSDQGKKFLKFITDYDFSSEQGRNAAEKNAYSLLRKRKYAAAASFFLLAEPPMMKTALDVIISQLQDISLAFFIARLIDNTSTSSCRNDGSLTIGGGFNLSSMGGGGGFAGSGNVIDGGSSLETEDETEKFDSWNPKLGRSARSVLLSQLSFREEDKCFQALQLLWLGRSTESMLRLAHVPTSGSMSVDLSFPHNLTSLALKETVLDKANQIINFCSGPTLLKRLNPKKRVLWSSALLVSRALSRCGIDIPATNVLSHCADPAERDEVAKIGDKVEKLSPQKTSSSARAIAPHITNATNENASSSIFKSFDLAPPKPAAIAMSPSRPIQKPPSIFDNFDVVPPKSTKPITSDPISSSIFDMYEAPPRPQHSAPRPSSDPIFDSYDAIPHRTTPSLVNAVPSDSMMPAQVTSSNNQARSSQLQKSSAKVDVYTVDEEIAEPIFHIPDCSAIWNKWRERQILVAGARTFIRELARLINSLDGEPHYLAINDFGKRDHPLIPAGAAEVLHKACCSEMLLNSISESLSTLSTLFGITETSILEEALELLSADRNPKHIIFSVIIHSLLGRGDLAEDIVRDAASLQTNSCEFLGFSNDMLIDNADTRYYTSSLWARREWSSVIWQLELCLWLSRGGMFELSSTALKETVVAIRIGFTIAAWGRCHHSLDTLVKAIPDCLMDFDAGKNLWRSMKIIATDAGTVDGIDCVTSGGWEFLVDCRREEATEMLRGGKIGQFLIRPHPQDSGMFTLSFKTNLIPTEQTQKPNPDPEYKTVQDTPEVDSKKVIKRDDVVQHAIIRLTDSGFRCGSFGPYATLINLLHAVSDSLPFDLRFRDPPIKGVIGMKGVEPSPNSILFRQMALHTKAEVFRAPNLDDLAASLAVNPHRDGGRNNEHGDDIGGKNHRKKIGLFAQLLYLTEFRKQLCAVAAAADDNPDGGVSLDERDDSCHDQSGGTYFRGDSFSVVSHELDHEEALSSASRLVRPLLNWVRAREIEIVDEVTPPITNGDVKSNKCMSLAIKNLDDGSEVLSGILPAGDSMIRKMIQADSGVDFRTLRVGEAGNSVIVVLFGKQDAIRWLMTNVSNENEADAKELLKVMERMRVIEPVTSSDLSIPKSYAASHPSTELRYRFVDPWEVDALESRSGEKASAALGRGQYHALNVGLIASASENVIRSAGGVHLLSLWSTLKGGIALTKALCSAHPSWERDAGGDLLMNQGFLMEPSPYENSIRHHVYGNDLFRRLGLPQRFLALLQVELLDLKNITSPSGSSALSAYALLRLKRQGSSAPLNHKARSLDSACTQVRKISKSSGQNAPASWGSYVRFRFPLPEDVDCEGKSFDRDRELLFKGPPTCLQMTVYEKKFMSEIELGGADVNLESLGSGGQIEEWVPLRAGKDGITWFARVRLTLRFELLCLVTPALDDLGNMVKDEQCPSVGLKKIQKLSRLGAHEDTKQGAKTSISTPDLVGYFGNMLY